MAPHSWRQFGSGVGMITSNVLYSLSNNNNIVKIIIYLRFYFNWLEIQFYFYWRFIIDSRFERMVIRHDTYEEDDLNDDDDDDDDDGDDDNDDDDRLSKS